MHCKDRVFERFRSLYAQRPTQSSVLRRRLVFNAEVAEYACISHVASRDHNMLAPEGIVELIPGLAAQWVIKLSSTDPDCLHFSYGEEILTLFRPLCLGFFYSFFKT